MSALCQKRTFTVLAHRKWRQRRLSDYDALALTCRDGPISAGWNGAAEANVQVSDKASNLPMLEIPGLLENIRLLKAVAVISALKRTGLIIPI
jgi:hypothetical protein